MTPHERAVRAVETPGWLVKETTPTIVDLPHGARATVNVETVTLRGAMLTELIEKEIAEAVAAEREACAQLIDDLPPEEYVSVNPAALIRARSNS